MKSQWMMRVLILFMLMVPFTSSINAQEDAASAWQEIARDIPEELTSVQMDGEMIIGLESQGLTSQLGRLGMELIFNDRPIGLQFLMDITSPFLGGEPLRLEIYAADGMTYIYESDSDEWQIEAWNVTEEEIQQELETLLADISSNQDFTNLTNNQSSFLNKYFDLQNTGSLYIFSLVENIDGEEFYYDFEEAFDIKSLIEEAAVQAQTNADQLGDVLDQDISQYESELEELFQVEYFEMFFDMQPELMISYEIETGRVYELVFNLQIDTSLFADEISTEEAASLPEIITLETSFVFSQYGNEFEITLPSQVPSPDASGENDNEIDPLNEEESSSNEIKEESEETDSWDSAA